MNAVCSPSASDRFASIIDGLCRLIASPRSWGPQAGSMTAGPVILLIWTRLRRMGIRFARLAERVRAGNAAVRREPASSRPVASGADPSHARPRPAYRLSEKLGWLIRLAPEAACFGSQLWYLLTDPEIAALLKVALQMGRLLRPLRRMLAVRPDPDLLWPPSSRRRRASNRATGETPRANALPQDIPDNDGERRSALEIQGDNRDIPGRVGLPRPQGMDRKHTATREGTRGGLVPFRRRSVPP